MSDQIRVSVITPTWQRHASLLEQCLPCVQAQVGVVFEHIVVSDGPDPELRAKIPSFVRYFELPEHDSEPHWGAPARNFALTQARGHFIAYLDDDDLWESNHLVSLLDALDDDPDADFARSCGMIPHGVNGFPWRIGDGNLAHGRVTTSMLMHRRSLDAPWVSDNAEDWKLVKSWLDAGVLCARTGQATVTYNPSSGSENVAYIVTLEEF